MKLKMAFYHPSSVFLNNRIFAFHDGHPTGMGAHLLYPYWQLQKYMAGEGIDLQTYDMFEQRGEKVDIVLAVDPIQSSMRYLLRKRFEGTKLILWANETKADLGNSKKQRFMWKLFHFIPQTLPIFSVMLTHDSDLINNRKVRRLMIPQPFFPSHYIYRQRKRSRFAIMMFSHKYSQTLGELYSLRRQIIRFAEAKYSGFFDLYGIGWNADGDDFFTTLYRGVAEDKLDTLSNYLFCFCPENFRSPGYITEKPFDALFAGCVPIYLGAQDAEDFLPEDCFVDMQNYHTLDNLFSELFKIAKSNKLALLQEAGWQFLNSFAFHKFSVENFCETICLAVNQAVSV